VRPNLAQNALKHPENHQKRGKNGLWRSDLPREAVFFVDAPQQGGKKGLPRFKGSRNQRATLHPGFAQVRAKPCSKRFETLRKPSKTRQKRPLAKRLAERSRFFVDAPQQGGKKGLPRFKGSRNQRATLHPGFAQVRPNLAQNALRHPENRQKRPSAKPAEGPCSL
jgi:hypothetical protein